MDLKEFVSKALVDIMDGVADAQRKVSGGQIVPEFDITLTDSRGQAAGVRLFPVTYRAVNYDIHIPARRW